LQACRQHRRKFGEHQRVADVLIQVRRNAEQVITEDAAETEAMRGWKPPPLAPGEEPPPF
jgi:hypothetical protein